MSYEDFVTIKAFLMALETLEQPFPEKFHSPQLIQELGWTREQATAIRYRFAAFREDWEAPGMDVYDDL